MLKKKDISTQNKMSTFTINFNIFNIKCRSVIWFSTSPFSVRFQRNLTFILFLQIGSENLLYCVLNNVTEYVTSQGSRVTARRKLSFVLHLVNNCVQGTPVNSTSWITMITLLRTLIDIFTFVDTVE